MLEYHNGKKSPSLEKLQKVQLEILEQFTAHCSTHGLTYFLVAGSALGAVRHQGMIPWDDDIDVGMLRVDYDKLVESMKDQPISGHFFQTPQTDPDVLVDYAKLRKDNTYFEEFISNELNIHNGIFIDIFPFDPAFENNWKRKLQISILTIVHLIATSSTKAVCDAAPKRTVRILRRFLYKIRPILPIRLIRNFHDWLIQLGRLESSKMVGCVDMYGVQKYNKTILAEASLIPVKMTQFEDQMQPVPRMTEDYLTQIFGNYMEFPPEESRKPAHASLVKFSDSNA